MSRKSGLIAVLSILTLLGVSLISYPFLVSLGISDKSKHNNVVLIRLPNLQEGVLEVVSVNNAPLFILKPSKEQMDSINQLNGHVWTESIDTFNQELGAYVYWGVSAQWECPLSHKPPQESQLIKWQEDAKWLGGYWNAGCEVSYDYAGRAIKTYSYTFSGYDAESRNLGTPGVFRKTRDGYAVSIIGY